MCNMIMKIYFCSRKLFSIVNVYSYIFSLVYRTRLKILSSSSSTDKSEVKMILFVMFVIVYLINLLANLGMNILIRMDPQLQTPVYFFPQQPLLL